jgi:hypothetical protein
MVRGEEFQPFWHQLHADRVRKLLFVCGAGFDPRALSAVKAIADTGIEIVQCQLIEFGSGSGLVADEDLKRAEAHRSTIRALFKDETLTTVQVAMRSQDGRSTGGIRISEAFRNPKSYVGFSDVVIDITALPAELYFPLIATLLTLWRSRQEQSLDLGNLHVVVCDNPTVDSMITSEGGDKAELMYGFTGTLQRASIGSPIPIWAPVLGENQHERLLKITEFLRPEVIAPVLPFPARNPRRGDDLLLEYSSLIYETWGVDPTDLIYADEQNPFDVYAKLCTLAQDYAESLRAIGTAQVVVSSHSSKLHSLGALLAAFEQRLGVAHVQPTGHVVNGSFTGQHAQGELFEIWLDGEAYE